MPGRGVEAQALSPRAVSAGRLSTEEVYERLRRQILEHTIPPATRINIYALAQQLGVSATPVREALRLLQGDNLLVATSNRGYATTPVLDAAGVRDLYEFRLLIEPWAARVAASSRLGNPAPQLRGELSSFNRDADSIQHAMISHDSRFHGAIVLATENQTVIKAFEQSHCHLHLFRMIRSDWDWSTSLHQHEEIADAIAAVDPDRAEAAMRNHLKVAYSGFREYMAVGAAAGRPLIEGPPSKFAAN